MRNLVTRDQEANAGTYGAVAVGAQFGAGAAQAAAIIVCSVDQVAEIGFARATAALELDAALVADVVEQQLVVAGPAEFLAADAPLGGAVAVTSVVGSGTMPQRAVAAGQVALARIRSSGTRSLPYSAARSTEPGHCWRKNNARSTVTAQSRTYCWSSPPAQSSALGRVKRAQKCSARKSPSRR
jgi:hypothetical protein